MSSAPSQECVFEECDWNFVYLTFDLFKLHDIFQSLLEIFFLSNSKLKNISTNILHFILDIKLYVLNTNIT